jgi:hypothetical protein
MIAKMRNVITLLILAALFPGCGTLVADYSARFHVRGRLVDKSGQAVSDAEVLFTDVGLDQWVSPNQFVVTRTKSDGTFDVAFDYKWGREDRKVMSDTFDLDFRKNGVPLGCRRFVRSKMPSADGEIIVEAEITANGDLVPCR